MVTLGAVFTALPVLADKTDKLIELDKRWGEATKAAQVEAMFADDMVSIGEDGLGDRASMLAALAENPPEGPYMAGDYKVQFLDGNTAIMVHNVKDGDDTHWSMHVWRKQGGGWQVVAHASVEEDDD
jgi:hypothetical protein